MRITAVVFLWMVFSCISFAQLELNTDKSSLFSGSGNCQLCHQAGTSANVSQAQEDVSPPTGWRSSMMASAARDPFWQATVMAESIDHPELAAVIQDKCTNCHTPMGHEQAHADGASSYSLTQALLNGLAMDAVSCTLCHQVTADNFGTAESFSGGYKISDTRVTFGPYENPLIQPMKNMSGYEPVHSAHIAQAELCGTCHTLFTPFLDKQGQIAGEFPEQATFLEWKASAYPGLGQTCQQCHMPPLDEPIKISVIPQTAVARQPVYPHLFVGGNTIIPGIMKSHTYELGATANEDHYAKTIALARRQLQEQTAILSSSGAFTAGSELSFTVEVRNLAGHKFPSGFPSRRAWLHVTVEDADQQTVFNSGSWNSEYEITDLDEPFEPHYDVIRSADEVQIWESVMGDVDGDVTSKLMHGAKYLKDNRIPPRGFDAAAMANDTMGVVGVDGDGNFNPFDGMEYTGSDAVEYRIPIDNAWKEPFHVTVSLNYQSIKPAFIENLDEHDAPEIADMHEYYHASPVNVEILRTLEMDSQELNDVPSVVRPAEFSLDIFPQPLSATGGMLGVRYTADRASDRGEILVMSMLGQVLHHEPLRSTVPGQKTQYIDLAALRPGMYFVVLRVGDGQQAAPLCIAP
ncbi:MAG: T9SS type A sorting domain-containing protein [Bacteroidetes bacterium]|nr:T9SS type A sorting domain-containing protein [Bacteroidota bacterium]